MSSKLIDMLYLFFEFELLLLGDHQTNPIQFRNLTKFDTKLHFYNVGTKLSTRSSIEDKCLE